MEISYKWDAKDRWKKWNGRIMKSYPAAVVKHVAICLCATKERKAVYVRVSERIYSSEGAQDMWHTGYYIGVNKELVPKYTPIILEVVENTKKRKRY